MPPTRIALSSALAGALLLAACGDGGDSGGDGGGSSGASSAGATSATLEGVARAGRAEAEAAGGNLAVSDHTLITKEDLKAHFGWDESNALWRWDGAIASGSVVNGRVFLLAPATVDRRAAITYAFGSNNQIFGRACLGNLALDGTATLKREGLYLHPDSKLRYTSGDKKGPCDKPEVIEAE